MFRVLLDGKPVECSEGTTIGDLLPDHDPALAVGVLRPGQISHAETMQFLLKTTAGDMVVETTQVGSTFAWSEIRPELPYRMEDRVSVSFGPFSADFSPARRPARYERGDVILGCGGYDPNSSMLVFARRTHAADHGAAVEGGRIGVVISGRGVMDRIGSGAMILGIEPVVSFSESVDAFTTTDMSYQVSDGIQIISSVLIEVQGSNGNHSFSDEAADSVDRLLLALKSGRFTVGQRLSTHIRCDTLAGTAVPYDLGAVRREGSVMMRTSGKNQGSVYIYTEDLPRSLAHTLVGQVTHGIELSKIAKNGDTFGVTIYPQRFDLIGLTLEDAKERAEEEGIVLVPDKEGEDRMIVGQNPPSTLKALSAGTVTVNTVPKSQFIDIILDDAAAPDTCRIFREITGLKFHSVGKLPLFFVFDEVYLFQTEIAKTTNVKPENTPDDVVAAGMLAMTNESRKGVGMIGIRASDNSEFGPTSEPFSGTNVIGRVYDLKKLEGLKEGDMVYFREVT